jgi:D-alanyl-D-alanine carboxypeptidase
MMKKMIFCAASMSLLAGCSNLSNFIEEKKPLEGDLHSTKTSVPTALVFDQTSWIHFFQQDEAAAADEETDEIKNNEGTGDEREPGEEQQDSEPAAADPAPPSEEETIPVVANPGALNVIVNKFWALPEGYRPPDLIRPNVPFSFGNETSDRSKLRAEASESLEVMFEAAKSDGLELYARSGFRSYETQELIFKNEIANFGYEQAVLYVARPGTSEHQTGLAMDITAKSVNLELVESFEGTAEGKWLASNAHHYGFILRYPKGKTSITGYAFEPWHFRYVGADIATEIFTKDITLEEYMGDVREY